MASRDKSEKKHSHHHDGNTRRHEHKRRHKRSKTPDKPGVTIKETYHVFVLDAPKPEEHHHKNLERKCHAPFPTFQEWLASREAFPELEKEGDYTTSSSCSSG
jgi:hypothetical protein